MAVEQLVFVFTQKIIVNTAGKCKSHSIFQIKLFLVLKMGPVCLFRAALYNLIFVINKDLLLNLKLSRLSNANVSE